MGIGLRTFKWKTFTNQKLNILNFNAYIFDSLLFILMLLFSIYIIIFYWCEIF